MRGLVAFAFALLGLLQFATTSANAQVYTALNDAPSVKLHVTLKRKQMKLHGVSEFDVYATPVVSADGTRVLYDGYVTFVDNGSEFTYALLNGTAYVTTKAANGIDVVRCLPPHTWAFDKILPALNGATPIPSASIGKEAVQCASGNLFKTSFVGTQYAICASGKAGFTAFSSDMDIAVEYLDGRMSIPKPDIAKEAGSCEPIEEATSLTPTALALVTGGEIPSSASRMLKAESHMAMHEAQCKCMSKPRPCLFFHGSGNTKEAAELQKTNKLIAERFGDMYGHAPCCSMIRYSVLNTYNSGWANDTLQHKYCEQMLSMSNTSDKDAKIIDNTIIVTHSMGGLVVAGALASAKCKFSPTTSWVATSPPMTGSMGSDYAITFCNSAPAALAPKLAKLIGNCPVSRGRKSTVYQGESHSNPSLDAAYVAAQKAYRENVEAAMCSDSFFGLLSSFQAPSIFGGTVLPHKSIKNDGLVEYMSCVSTLDEIKFSGHYTSPFYKPKLNHADTAFLAGDGIFSNDRKPLKWFECLEL